MGASVALIAELERLVGRLTLEADYTLSRAILQRMFPNAQEAARILSELTGEDIWAKLQKMDLQAVLRTLEQAAGP